jgi:hypothetical protein
MRSPRLVVAIAVLCAPACVIARGDRNLVHGTYVRVDTDQGDWPHPLAGELVAVDSDSLWVFQDRELLSVPMDAVSRASIRRSVPGGRTALIWSLLGGLITGGALTAACASVASDCGSVFTGTMLAWGISAAVAIPSMEGSRYKRIREPLPNDLRSYARFPQGLPPDSLQRLLVRKP